MAAPSPEQVKQIYMASKNIEWIPFAKSMQWDPVSTRAKYQVTEWIQQKKLALAQEQAENISELIFGHRSRWHHDVLKTLRDYPEVADATLGIIKHRANEMIGQINYDIEEKAKAAQENRDPVYKFKSVKTSELVALSMAIKTVTETKHKSLLINDWSVKVAEQFTDPAQFERNESQMKDTGWTLEVIGGENLTSQQLEEMLGKYYDKPMNRQIVDVQPTPPPIEGDDNAEG